MFTSLGMLDCGPQPDFWYDFFAPRWPGLTTGPVEAVAARARWLQAVQPDAFHANAYERVQATLELLKRGQYRRPSPSRGT